MKITLVGISHHTAPVSLREKLALSTEQAARAAGELRRRYPAVEVVILSTCNRVEWYIARPAQQPPEGDELRAFIAEQCGVSSADLLAASIHRDNQQAVEHLFRVASGLESMVLGEPQVLGQIKRSYEQAAALGVVGVSLHRLFQQAIGTGKQVRRETGIDEGRVSVGAAAVDFARQIFESFDDKVVVGIGAGEMAKLTLKHLLSLQPRKLWLVNRSIERAAALAAKLNLSGDAGPFGGVRRFEDLDELLVEADIVMTSTGSPAPIITAERFKPLLKRRRSRPLFLIDIAVPRDVEQQVGALSNVYLYNIDDLQQVVEHTHAARAEHAQQASATLLRAAETCMAEIQNHDIGTLIRELRQRLHDLGEVERLRTLRRMESAPREQLPQLLEEHTQRVINKILHLPVSQLDRRQPAAVLGFFAAALRRLFSLDGGRPIDESSDESGQARQHHADPTSQP